MRQPLNVDKVIIESLAARVQELSCLLLEEVKDKEHFQAECLRYEKLLGAEQNNLNELLDSLFASTRSTSNDSDELKWWKDEVRDILECYYPTKGVE